MNPHVHRRIHPKWLPAALVILALGWAATLPLAAQTAGGAAPARASPTTADSGSELTEGEVRKIDAEAGKITLKHAEIKNLDMPGMTMVFVVRDKSLLNRLKAGDKVRFKAIKDGGQFTVTEIQAAP